MVQASNLATLVAVNKNKNRFWNHLSAPGGLGGGPLFVLSLLTCPKVKGNIERNDIHAISCQRLCNSWNISVVVTVRHDIPMNIHSSDMTYAHYFPIRSSAWPGSVLLIKFTFEITAGKIIVRSLYKSLWFCTWRVRPRRDERGGHLTDRSFLLTHTHTHTQSSFTCTCICICICMCICCTGTVPMHRFQTTTPRSRNCMLHWHCPVNVPAQCRVPPNWLKTKICWLNIYGTSPTDMIIPSLKIQDSAWAKPFDIQNLSSDIGIGMKRSCALSRPSVNACSYRSMSTATTCTCHRDAYRYHMVTLAYAMTSCLCDDAHWRSLRTLVSLRSPV